MALAPGDIVLVRMKAFEQDHKIADKWKQDPHVVISQMGNQPVFKIQPKNAKNKDGIRILHWNMLYSIQSAQNDVQDITAKSLVKSVMALTKANMLIDLHFGDV